MRMRHKKQNIVLLEIDKEGKWQKRKKHKQTYF